MNSSTPPKRTPGRKRSQRARIAILGAAREMLDDGGINAVTVEGIAERAGVGKPTIYRYWPNAKAVAMAALLESEDWSAESPPGKGLAVLRKQLANVVRAFSSSTGRQVALMVAASDRDTELSKVFRKHFILTRREEARGFLTQAIAAGEIRGDIDLEVALDMIYGPLFFRLLLGEGELDVTVTEAIVATLVAGIGR